MTDHDFVTSMRNRVERAPLTSTVSPNEVRERAQRSKQHRRTMGASGVVGVLALAAIVIQPSLYPTADLPPTGLTAGAPSSDDLGSLPTATPSAPDTNGVQRCAGFRPNESVDASRATDPAALEGWWNGTPTSPDGKDMPIESWPRQVLDHPATAQINTREGTVVETFDRRTCTSILGFTPPQAENLPSNSIVVIDAETGEVLETQPLSEITP